MASFPNQLPSPGTLLASPPVPPGPASEQALPSEALGNGPRTAGETQSRSLGIIPLKTRFIEVLSVEIAVLWKSPRIDSITQTCPTTFFIRRNIGWGRLTSEALPLKQEPKPSGVEVGGEDAAGRETETCRSPSKTEPAGSQSSRPEETGLGPRLQVGVSELAFAGQLIHRSHSDM